MPDNCDVCRERLFHDWDEQYSLHLEHLADEGIRDVAWFVLARNIQCGDCLAMRHEDGTPIIFSEWAFINQDKVKRRDFRLDMLLETGQDEGFLFGNPAIPQTVREFHPIDYRKVHKYAIRPR